MGVRSIIKVFRTDAVEDSHSIDTTNVLFIFSGAFVGLEDIVKSRRRDMEKVKRSRSAMFLFSANQFKDNWIWFRLE